MGYILHGFIGRREDLRIVEQKYKSAKLFNLADEISLIPMTADLFDEINNYRSNNSIGKFELLTTDVEKEILEIINGKTISYIEADYFGGQGGQSGIIWQDGKRTFESDFDSGVINKVLSEFGVVRSESMDEFDTVRLGRHRRTEDWLKE